jgi:hypothetical protein
MPPQIYNVYCDESCHLEHDGIPVMVLGALSCPADQVRTLSLSIRSIKRKHRLPDAFEIKWAKVSPAKTDFYLEVVDHFFGEQSLSFRALVAPDKSKLRHAAFQQTHDQWYYKMYYHLLRPIPCKQKQYRIFLDIKDTHSSRTAHELADYLQNAIHDFSGNTIASVQPASSREVTPIQLSDLLAGAMAYANRGLATSSAKLAIIQRIKQHSHLTLKCTTAPGRAKLDIFICEAKTEDAKQ